MKRKDIQSLCDFLDERLAIAGDNINANTPDAIYYRGAIHCLLFMGFDYIIKNGKHIILK